ncbi:MAG: hypothetical protein HY785_11240 [Oscillatoriophycideae cyanobacterium NC_groundwater_1537_Pr4_S-0.65um_50_18]|nr:hypothetical protein [Oscillatoriophycideae cyanobacterium NC_groundwater_1537_Pr4_S-0.65um_50_18]
MKSERSVSYQSITLSAPVYIANSEWAMRAMQTSWHLSVHSGAIASLCIGSFLTAAQEAEAVWVEQERAEIAKNLLG